MGGSGSGGGDRPHPFHAGHPFVHGHDLAPGAHASVDAVQQAGKTLPDPQTMNLDREEVGVAVDYETTEAISIGVDEAIGVGVGTFTRGKEDLPQIEGAVDGTIQDVRLTADAVTGRDVVEHPEGDAGSWVEETLPEELAFLVEDCDP